MLKDKQKVQKRYVEGFIMLIILNYMNFHFVKIFLKNLELLFQIICRLNHK